MLKKSNKPNVQEITEIVGRYSEKSGPGVLVVKFSQYPDASYDLSGMGSREQHTTYYRN